MAHPSYESAGSPRSIGDLLADQRPGYSFERALYTTLRSTSSRWTGYFEDVGYSSTMWPGSLAQGI